MQLVALRHPFATTRSAEQWLRLRTFCWICEAQKKDNDCHRNCGDVQPSLHTTTFLRTETQARMPQSYPSELRSDSTAVTELEYRSGTATISTDLRRFNTRNGKTKSRIQGGKTMNPSERFRKGALQGWRTSPSASRCRSGTWHSPGVYGLQALSLFEGPKSEETTVAMWT